MGAGTTHKGQRAEDQQVFQENMEAPGAPKQGNEDVEPWYIR